MVFMNLFFSKYPCFSDALGLVSVQWMYVLQKQVKNTDAKEDFEEEKSFLLPVINATNHLQNIPMKFGGVPQQGYILTNI